jgi:hypothetical protein
VSLSSAVPDVRHSLGGLPLRASLTRGALIAAANWPLILIEFVALSLFQSALAVPALGGAFVVAVLAQADVAGLLSQGLRPALALVAAALVSSPVTLWAFLAAVGVVAVGGTVVLSVVQSASAAVLVEGERRAPESLHRPPLRWAALQQTHVYDPEALFAGIRRHGRRFVVLGVWGCVSYTLVGAAATGVGGLALMATGLDGWAGLWPLALTMVIALGVLAASVVNLVWTLVQVVVATEDCRLRVAVRRVRGFLLADARQVAGIYGVVLSVTLAATATSILATAGLALVAWVPVVGLVVVPLQIAAWLVRGLVFHYVDLSAWAAYQSQFRRWATPPEGASAGRGSHEHDQH